MLICPIIMLVESFTARQVQLLVELFQLFRVASNSILLHHEEVCILFVVHGKNSVTNPLTIHKLTNAYRCCRVHSNFLDHSHSISRSAFPIELYFCSALLFLLFLFSFKLVKRILARWVFLHVVVVDDAFCLHHIWDFLYTLGGSAPYRFKRNGWGLDE